MAIERVTCVTACVMALAACAGRLSQEGTDAAGQVRGLYISGFETSHFRPCGQPAGPAKRILRDSALTAVIQRADGGRTRFGAWIYDAYYVHWQLEEIAPPRPGIITTRPRWRVVRSFETRAPREGECGFHAATDSVGRGAP